MDALPMQLGALGIFGFLVIKELINALQKRNGNGKTSNGERCYREHSDISHKLERIDDNTTSTRMISERQLEMVDRITRTLDIISVRQDADRGNTTNSGA